MKKILFNEFILCVKKIHKEKYDYSISKYVNMTTKIKIVCPVHGVFEQMPYEHKSGKGCNRCSGRAKLTTNDFIKRASVLHNNKYGYNLVNYINGLTKVKIICPIHGIFEQKANGHLNGKGCKKCVGKDKATKDVIEEMNSIHNNKYDYSLVKYKNAITKIKIVCKKHGVFHQRPNDHLNGVGCPKCCSSKGEFKIRNFLQKNNITFEEQKKFNNCKDKRCLPFDFYLPNRNTLIEYDGQQHFGIGRFATNKLITNDYIKTEFAEQNNIKLIRIPYTKIKEIDTILEEILR